MQNPKYFLFTVSILILGAASAHAKILRDAAGNIREMNQYDAMKACPAGTHLPTIRELAKESQARGAKGILEVGQVNPEEIPDGYFMVSAINPDGRKDEFYFNDEGYRRPDNDLDHGWFWSSSVDSRTSDMGYYFSGRSGSMEHDDRRTDFIAVWCIGPHQPLPPPTEIGSCEDRPGRPQVGSVCRTSAGVLFKRVQGGYQDLGEGGMVWYDGLVKKVNQYEALDYCEKAGLNLPSGYPPVLNESYGKDSDFVTAEKHGIREVFGDMKGRNFWSSSLYPNIYDQAYYFVGASGAVSDARRDYYRDRTAYDSFSARCVGRARVQ